MVDLVTLVDVRHQLRLDGDDTSEDALLTGYIAAAQRVCEAYVGFAIAGATSGDIAVVRQAMLMLIGWWFANREADGAAPAAVTWLLRPIRRQTL